MRPKHLGLAALLVALFGAGFLAGKSPAGQGTSYRNLDTFVEVLDKIEQNYVDPVESDKLVNGAIGGLMRRLDPFSQYLDKQSYGDLKSLTQGHFGGLGIVISIRDDFPTVISPLEGTPAYSTGIQSGDVIVRIDGKSTRGLTSEEAVHKLRGPEGSSVTISVAREGESERDYAITREIIQVKSVPYAFEVSPGIGYLRVSTFSESTGEEVEKAITRFERAGIRGLVLDLRDNPGGLLSQAVDVTEAFVAKGSPIVTTKGRATGANTRVEAEGTSPHTEQPLVVLLNDGSASASEIVAGAIQDLDRGLLVGTTSFGKGSVQSLIELKGRGAALKLTTARYYTPSGRSIHRDSWNKLADDDPGASDFEAEREDPALSPHDAAGDTANRPKFKTRAGRIVYGGGGILPDEIVLADTLRVLARDIERRGLYFKYAGRYAARHKGEPAPTTVTPQVWREFREMLAESKVPATEADLLAERPVLERGLRRELARRMGGTRGDEAAFKVAIEADRQLARAIELLNRAKSPGELVRLTAR